LTAFAAADSPAAQILCRQQAGFSCPIVANASGNLDGNVYDYESGVEGTWIVSGPWGIGNASITVSGNSRCSDTPGTYPNIGNPSPSAGKYCWCQMVNAGFSGAWANLFTDVSATDCIFYCAFSCAGIVGNEDYSGFRFAVCRPQILGSCDGTTMIATSGICPSGYVQCVGSKTSSGTAGNYTITCSE
jgi:hypothetical protein